jgi:hypothetical protein
MFCPAECGWRGHKLEQHFRWSPHCKPCINDGPPAAKRSRNPQVAAQLFSNRVVGVLGKALLSAHVDHYMQMTELDKCQSLVQLCVSMTCDFIEGELTHLGCPHSSDTIKAARHAFSRLPNVGTLVEQRRAVYQRAIPRHLTSGVGGDKKGAVFFNAHTLVTIILQENSHVRKLATESNNLWKSGVLYKTRPRVMTDLVHGSRFLDWHAVCGRVSPNEANDFRVVLHGWNDAFTPIDGLSQKARQHHYDTVLVSMVNLPLRVRHFVDHILLLAIWNGRY